MYLIDHKMNLYEGDIIHLENYGFFSAAEGRIDSFSNCSTASTPDCRNCLSKATVRLIGNNNWIYGKCLCPSRRITVLKSKAQSIINKCEEV